MDHQLAGYLPQDRCDALARSFELPSHTTGAALFADISGFTPLTEALAEALGARRGAEALTDQINRVYAALIAHVDTYGGSVVGFAGDAITCWFDDANGLAAARAAACALAMQQAMQAFTQITLPNGTTTALTIKVGIAYGPARRFAVGNPAVQRLDVLAGATIARMAATEHLAERGEVVLDRAAAEALGPGATLAGWREDATGLRAAVLTSLPAAPPAHPWPTFSTATLPADVLQPWVLRPVFKRIQAGLGGFLTELRPAVALFLHFSGLDFDGDADAATALDTLVRLVQSVLGRYNGTLLQLTIGDKGNYLYAVFGAPSVHEDDARRAVLAALDLQTSVAGLGTFEPPRIGISQGMLRCGAYGGASRRTYGALGDEVNIAARLMSQAAPGEVLVSGRVQFLIATTFALDPRPPIRLKGKAEPLPVFAITGLRRRRAIRLEEPSYSLPMVGREAEMAQIAQAIDQALAGHGQIVGISAEAGLGKSRLAAEGIRLARQHGMLGYGGECQATGITAPYLVWEPIWRAFFDIDPDDPPRRQRRALENEIDDRAPDRITALPLLGPLLGLSLNENEFTAGLGPRERQAVLHALLCECFIAAAREMQSQDGGLLLVLEDLQWIDAASHDLLRDLANLIADLPVIILLAYRPPDLARLQTPQVEALPYFSRITLDGLGAAEAEQLIRAKLAQLFPARGGGVPAELVKHLTQRAQGNPFYLEELLNYLRDRAIDPRDTAALQALALPDSLHALILSRLDSLHTRQQITLKTASVIGRRFLVSWLRDAYPNLIEPAPLQADLATLALIDLTPLDTPEPELAYLFKHIVTREVAYESLSIATRATLHEQFARYLEQAATGESEPLLDVLAYHYDHSDNLPKKREYLQSAGIAAASRFANDAALEYLGRALEVAPPADAETRYSLLLAREQVYDRLAHRSAQVGDLTSLAALAETLDSNQHRAEIATRRARYELAIDGYAAASAAARQAISLAAEAGDAQLQTEGYNLLGRAYRQLANFADAKAELEQAQALALLHGLRDMEAASYQEQGIIADLQGDYNQSWEFFERALRLFQATGNRIREGGLQTNLGVVAWRRGHYTHAAELFEQALRIAHETGSRGSEMNTLANLGLLAQTIGQHAHADAYYEQALPLSRAIGSRYGESRILNFLSVSALYQGLYERAQVYDEQALQIAIATSDRQHEFYVQMTLGEVARRIGDFARSQEHYEQARAIATAERVVQPITHLCALEYQRGDLPAAVARSAQVRALTEQTKDIEEQGYGWVVLGWVHSALGEPAAAVELHRMAVAALESENKLDRASEARAYLAQALFDSGEPNEALAQLERVLDEIERFSAIGPFEPLGMLLACWKVLVASNDARAAQVLANAHALLQTRSAAISDAAARERFLTQLAVNQAIETAWAHRATT